jgi:predicted dehydrogenase
MTQKEIRVGIVGANADASWAKLSHVPAIKGLPGVKLAAVATRNEHSARQAAEAFGADRWFSDPFAMIRDDQIDVVTQLYRDIHAGSYDTPGFEHALHNARLIEAVTRAAERGERQRVILSESKRTC